MKNEQTTPIPAGDPAAELAGDVMQKLLRLAMGSVKARFGEEVALNEFDCIEAGAAELACQVVITGFGTNVTAQLRRGGVSRTVLDMSITAPTAAPIN